MEINETPIQEPQNQADIATEATPAAPPISNAELALNADVKRDIIKSINQLLEKKECHKHMPEFKALLQRWKTTGPVPRSAASEINSAYKRAIDAFFGELNMSRELRELDQKHNLEAKLALCDQAEALATANSAVKAIVESRSLQAQWREIGTVPAEQRDAIWERFKAAISVVKQRYAKHEAAQHSKEKANYEAKLALCAEAETLVAETVAETKSQVAQLMAKVEEIQARWRKIGFAPKAVNDEVYARFREACNVAYNRRAAVQKTFVAELESNHKKKLELCAKAEALAESTDWKKTATALVALQKQWKTIGPSPRKFMDSDWARFRAACDKFFEARDQKTKAEEVGLEKNLEVKKALIEELKNLKLTDDADKSLAILQDLQQRWNAAGFVPLKDKAEVTAEFNSLLDKQFAKFGADDEERSLQRYSCKMAILASESDGKSKINAERNKLIAKLKQLETDINCLKNNIGFFTHSSKADSLIADVNSKIQNAQKNIATINAKLDVIDKLID